VILQCYKTFSPSRTCQDSKKFIASFLISINLVKQVDQVEIRTFKMKQVNIYEAKTHFSKLIAKVLDGEEIVIAKGNKPVAKLVQFTSLVHKRKLGSAKGEITIADDFKHPLEDFEDYTK
jgi:prevent-host-death family protein